MNLNFRLQKLEQQVPPAPEPKPDLSGLSTDELRLIVQYYGVEGTPEDMKFQVEAICEKIVWRYVQ